MMDIHEARLVTNWSSNDSTYSEDNIHVKEFYFLFLFECQSQTCESLNHHEVSM